MVTEHSGNAAAGQMRGGKAASNAARAKVAERYQSECSGMWIVAPIKRAVDDGTAKKLLGDIAPVLTRQSSPRSIGHLIGDGKLKLRRAARGAKAPVAAFWQLCMAAPRRPALPCAQLQRTIAQGDGRWPVGWRCASRGRGLWCFIDFFDLPEGSIEAA